LQKLNATPSLDGDSETWEEIRVPIRDMQALLPDPSEAEAISSIAVQALGTPSYNLMVGDCRIRLE
jgi:hypothetical protein